jgi:hypothetical protein
MPLAFVAEIARSKIGEFGGNFGKQRLHIRQQCWARTGAPFLVDKPSERGSDPERCNLDFVMAFSTPAMSERNEKTPEIGR